MPEPKNPAVGDTDTDIELRDSNFNFVVTNKPHLRNGNKKITPSHGLVTTSVTSGVWHVNFVQLSGAVIDAKGLSINKEAHFIYSFGFGPSDEKRETCHPDYAPPQWLMDFVANFENRLNGQKES
ncbi:hypothetical protein ABT282_08630 [Streptomyces sp. NPDC000927]|uniref:hypothetical protein n=1 Tax=Streptomyces sp. NPDC000927 TaxID=3154371 RepID=UPI003330A5FB